MRNKETLEEAAERILDNNIDGLRDALKDDDLFYFYKGVIQSYGEAMAKWQQERSYSEEDMLQALNIGFTSTDETWEECVEFTKEQFKKK